MAAFRGMHVSPAKHSYASVTDGQTDRQTDGRTDGQTTDKVIPMCRYASRATQKESTELLQNTRNKQQRPILTSRIPIASILHYTFLHV